MIVTIGMGALALASIVPWARLYRKGQQFALRDRLQRSDAIVVLAGSRGNLSYLEGRIRTAVSLYEHGWAPTIICSGAFSVKVTDTPELFPLERLQLAAARGRIAEKQVEYAAEHWDAGLGARYMCDQAVKLGVPSSAVIAESESLHTRENAEYVAEILETHHMRRIILVTSPFHQLRSYLTFAKVLQPRGIEILNYYADTDEWNPFTWFFSSKMRQIVDSEIERIERYRAKGDIL